MRRPKRRAIPLSVKLAASEHMLGKEPGVATYTSYNEKGPRKLTMHEAIDFNLLMLFGGRPQIQWDHNPALGLRAVNDEGTDYVPAQLDYRYIEPVRVADHARKTTGRMGASKLSITGNGDASRIAKAERLEKRRLGLDVRRKRRIPSRPFQKRRKPS